MSIITLNNFISDKLARGWKNNEIIKHLVEFYGANAVNVNNNIIQCFENRRNHK